MYYHMLELVDLQDKTVFENSFPKYGNLAEMETEELLEISRNKIIEAAESIKSDLGIDFGQRR